MVLNKNEVVCFLSYLDTQPELKFNYETKEFIGCLPESIRFHFLSYDNFLLYVNTLKKVQIGYDSKSYKKAYIAEDVKKAWAYFNSTKEEKIIVIKSINVILYARHKSGDKNIPSNNRYLQKHSEVLKIIDRILLSICITLSISLFDNNLFISPLENNFTKGCLEHAIENTKTKEKVVCLDIKDAFNSVKHCILYTSLIRLLSKKVTKSLAKIITDEYFLILVNRECYYEDIKINIGIGVPQGLSSSNFMFSVIIWNVLQDFKKDKCMYLFYLFMKIYVDDFYIKFYHYCEQNKMYLDNLVKILNIYNLQLNVSKSCADIKLKLNYPNIGENTLYLGIPFTRDIKTYINIILDDFNKKKNNLFNKQCNWLDIYLILKNKTLYHRNIMGFLSYKLKPFNQENNILDFILLNCLDFNQIQHV